MKFTFSPDFRTSLYQELLQRIGSEIDTYRQISGITVKEMMAAVHISHPVLKRY